LLDEDGIVFRFLDIPLAPDVRIQIEIAEFHIDEIELRCRQITVAQYCNNIFVLVVIANCEDCANFLFDIISSDASKWSNQFASKCLFEFDSSFTLVYLF